MRKKLTLNRSTLRRLTEAQTRMAHGGEVTYQNTVCYCFTITCMTPCIPPPTQGCPQVPPPSQFTPSQCATGCFP